MASVLVVVAWFPGPASAQDGAHPVITVEQPGPGPMLDEPFELRGGAAATILDRFGLADGVAARAAMETGELLTELRSDERMFVTGDGMVGYTEPTATAGHDPDPDPAAAAAAVPADVFDLDSRPGATRVVYLDFDGHVTTGDYWNSNYGIPTIVSDPYDIDGDPDTYTATELSRIYEIWQRVAEDYAPFDVNVTTDDPGTEGLRRTSGGDLHYGTRIVVSPSDWYESATGTRIGGIALLSVFSSSVDHSAFVFSSNLAGGAAKSVAEAASHEAGHNFGLRHDGKSSSTYYSGHGDWGPIMGTAYSRTVSQWSRGEYSQATNTEDDLAIIAGYVGLVPDDHADVLAAATVVSPTSTTSGLLGAGDADAFTVTVGAGDLDVTLAPASSYANLHAGLTVRDPSGTTVAAASPGSATGWSAAATATVAAGTYTIEVRRASWLTVDSGFSDYGSMGAYTLVVDAAAPGPTTSGDPTTTTSPPGPTTTTSPPPPSTTTTTTTTTTPPTTTPPASGSSRFTAITPVRLVDTRSALGGSRRLAGRQRIVVEVAGRNGIPATATSAVVTVTAVEPSAPGYLTVYPCTAQPSLTSAVNHAARQTIANTTIATLDQRGRMCVWTLAPTDVVVDVTGWLGPDGATGLTPTGPRRVADTRTGYGGNRRLRPAATMVLDLTPSIPRGTSAVAFNVSAVGASGAGFLTAYPCGTARPATSTVNYLGGEVRSNNSIVGVTNGRLCVYSHAAVDVVVDLVGTFGASGMQYRAMAPVRILDSRSSGRSIPAGATVSYRVRTADLGTLAPQAAFVNLTAVDHAGHGYVTTFDCGVRSTTAAVGQQPGQVTANGALVPVTPSTSTCAWLSGAGHLVVDLYGWWVP